MTKYIDTHAHYCARQFNDDRDDLLEEEFEHDCEYIIECGTNTKSIDEVLELCNKYEKLYCTIGYFPCDVHELEDRKIANKFLHNIETKKVAGIGEIGFDYHHKRDLDLQWQWFTWQINVAKEHKLPICIHSREAELDTMSLLRPFGEMKGVFHCYSYGVETMEELADLGYYFGVGGTSTYTGNPDNIEAIKRMPIDRIVLETDCPYLKPRAKGLDKGRNDSYYIGYVIQNLAKMRNISEEEIIKITNENAHRLYERLGK